MNSQLVQSLEELDLTNCGLSDDMVAVFAAAPPCARLHTLRLLDNAVTHDTVFALAEVASLRGTRRITLDGNPWSLDYDDDEEGTRADAQRVSLIARFGEGWWYENEPPTEIPEYYRQRRAEAQANPT